jgi:alanine racemase
LKNLRPTIAEINLSAIATNIRRIVERVRPAAVMAVVKADGYGHGAIPVARCALQAGATHLGVALLEEAIELRAAKIDAPILVFGGLFENQIDDFIARDVQATVYDFSLAEKLSRRAEALRRRAQVHVKVDTGMGRVGLSMDEASEVFARISRLPGLDVVGMYTHLTTSDERDKSYAQIQLLRFREVITSIDKNKSRQLLVHAANSGAVLDLPESYFNLVRPGVMIYGYYPSQETSESIPLEPAMTLRSEIIFVKRVPAGASISYGRKFTTTKPTTIATLPIGYADGISRRLSNNLEVLVRGRRCPLVGRVCMDQIMIDLGDMADVKVGEEVVLLGKQGGEEISIYEWCERLETIPYEVTCGISKRVRRVHK